VEYISKKLIFATGAMTKLEPSLNPVLKPAIEKYQAMKKNKELQQLANLQPFKCNQHPAGCGGSDGQKRGST